MVRQKASLPSVVEISENRCGLNNELSCSCFSFYCRVESVTTGSYIPVGLMKPQPCPNHHPSIHLTWDWCAPGCHEKPRPAPHACKPARACLCSAGTVLCSHQDKLDLTGGRLLWLMILPRIFSHSNLGWLYCCASVCVCVSVWKCARVQMCEWILLCLCVSILKTERVWLYTCVQRQVRMCVSIHVGHVTCTAVATPVIGSFVVQHFPSMWQAASPLYPGFVKESSKCQWVPLTPTGCFNCGSNQRWEVPSTPQHPNQKLSTLLLLQLPSVFFLFLNVISHRVHLPWCSWG